MRASARTESIRYIRTSVSRLRGLERGCALRASLARASSSIHEPREHPRACIRHAGFSLSRGDAQSSQVFSMYLLCSLAAVLMGEMGEVWSEGCFILTCGELFFMGGWGFCCDGVLRLCRRYGDVYLSFLHADEFLYLCRAIIWESRLGTLLWLALTL